MDLYRMHAVNLRRGWRRSFLSCLVSILCTMSFSWMQNSFNNLEMINAMNYQALYSLVTLIWEDFSNFNLTETEAKVEPIKKESTCSNGGASPLT